MFKRGIIMPKKSIFIYILLLFSILIVPSVFAQVCSPKQYAEIIASEISRHPEIVVTDTFLDEILRYGGVRADFLLYRGLIREQLRATEEGKTSEQFVGFTKTDLPILDNLPPTQDIQTINGIIKKFNELPEKEIPDWVKEISIITSGTLAFSFFKIGETQAKSEEELVPTEFQYPVLNFNVLLDKYPDAALEFLSENPSMLAYPGVSLPLFKYLLELPELELPVGLQTDVKTEAKDATLSKDSDRPKVEITTQDGRKIVVVVFSDGRQDTYYASDIDLSRVHRTIKRAVDSGKYDPNTIKFLGAVYVTVVADSVGLNFYHIKNDDGTYDFYIIQKEQNPDPKDSKPSKTYDKYGRELQEGGLPAITEEREIDIHPIDELKENAIDLSNQVLTKEHEIYDQQEINERSKRFTSLIINPMQDYMVSNLLVENPELIGILERISDEVYNIAVRKIDISQIPPGHRGDFILYSDEIAIDILLKYVVNKVNYEDIDPSFWAKAKKEIEKIFGTEEGREKLFVSLVERSFFKLAPLPSGASDVYGAGKDWFNLFTAYSEYEKAKAMTNEEKLEKLKELVKKENLEKAIKSEEQLKRLLELYEKQKQYELHKEEISVLTIPVKVTPFVGIFFGFFQTLTKYGIITPNPIQPPMAYNGESAPRVFGSQEINDFCSGKGPNCGGYFVYLAGIEAINNAKITPELIESLKALVDKLVPSAK